MEPQVKNPFCKNKTSKYWLAYKNENTEYVSAFNTRTERH